MQKNINSDDTIADDGDIADDADDGDDVGCYIVPWNGRP